MVDKKISELPTITQADIASGDWIPVVDSSTNTTKKYNFGDTKVDVTAFFNSNDSYTAGTIVGTLTEGFAYRAVGTATATTVANAGGQAFEVLPGNDGFVELEQVNILPSDSQDRSQAITNAVEKYGKIRGKAGATYYIETGTTANCTRDVSLDFEQSFLVYGTNGKLSLSNEVKVSPTLAASFLHGAGTFVVTDATGIQVGDLVFFNTTIAVDSDYSYPKCEVQRVMSISGTTIRVDKPFRFDFAPADAGLSISVCRPFRGEVKARMRLLSGTIRAVSFSRFVDVKTDGLEAHGPDSYSTTTYPTTPRAIQLSGCDGWTGVGMSCKNMGYAFVPLSGTRGTYFYGMKCENTRHPVDPAIWADGVHVDGLQATGSLNSINTHPAFDVNYKNATCWGEDGSINHRSIGGSIESSFVDLRAGAADNLGVSRTGAVNLNAGFEYLFDSTRGCVDGLSIVQSGAPYGILRFEYGNFFADRLNVKDLACFSETASLKFGSQVNANLIRNSTRIRKAVRIGSNPILDAVLTDGSYLIDPQQNYVDQTNRSVRAYGEIVTDAATGTYNVKIKEGAFGAYGSPNFVLGHLKLRAFVKHASSGKFDTLDQTYSWFHQLAPTSNAEFPTTPSVNVNSSTTGVNIAMTLSNVVQEGRSQVALEDVNISFDLSTDILATSPVVNITYELELIAV